MDLTKAMQVATAGLKAQGTRMRVIAENLANSNSIANGPNDEPYRRRVVSFRNEVDRKLGVHVVKVDAIEVDRSDFGRKYDPGHPAADADGYVRTTNVNGLIEQADMREAQRSYEANLNTVQASKSLLMRTLDLLR
ncbi:MAG: flagellar basal body rod protein FlgC [Alphaproteobacteria bacterium]|nr:MAG: flagellar basal body rod protein FlgC [Alphaproteobacteria bacterium]